MLANPIYSMSEMQVGYIYEDSTLNLLKKNKTKRQSSSSFICFHSIRIHVEGGACGEI